MTTSTLRPNGTASLLNNTVTGAASAHAATNDNSDSSYFGPSGASAGNVYLDLGTVSLPAGSVTKQIRVRARGRGTGGWTYGDLYHASEASVLSRVVVSAGDGSTVYDFSNSYAAVTLSQAQVDALKVKFVTSQFNTTARVLEVYADLVYVPIPVTTVGAVTPDPYTAATIVPISWVNTLDADGGAQTRYWVKVFTAAQYGAGGFDPETSTPTYDSGEQVSSIGTADVGPLSDGVTYRAYVKVAQTVNGASLWSAWAYDQFDVSVTTSDVDTVTATGSNSTASITVTVERDTGSAAWNFVEVERSTDAGSTWAPVRGATYVDATGDADTFTVTDYETSNGEPALYRARATRIVSTLPITGAWVQSTPAASWSSSSAWLKSPLEPAKNITVDIDDPFTTQSYGVRTGVFDIVGAAAPVAISDVLSLPASTLVVATYDDTEQTDLLDLLRTMLLLYHPTDCEGGTIGRYLAVTGVSFTPTVVRNRVARVWTISFVDVNAPADPAASAP